MAKELRVAKVLSERRIIINAGGDDGLKPGNQFVIYEYGDDILDPATKQSLGKIEIIKGQVEVIDVQAHMAIAQTVSRVVTRTRQKPNMFGLFSGYTVESYEVDVAERLKIASEDKGYQQRLIVREGDLLRPVKD